MSGKLTENTSGSIAVWVYPLADVAETAYSIMHYSWGEYNFGFEIYLYGSGSGLSLRIYGSAGSGSSVVYTGNDIPINTWSHIVVTGNGTIWTAYIDGVVKSLYEYYGYENSGCWFGTFVPFGTPLANEKTGIGTHCNDDGSVTPSFYGALDQFKLFASPLSQTEINALQTETPPVIGTHAALALSVMIDSERYCTGVINELCSFVRAQAISISTLGIENTINVLISLSPFSTAQAILVSFGFPVDASALVSLASTNNAYMTIVGSGIFKALASVHQLGTFLNKYYNVLAMLSRGDSTRSTSAIISSMPEDIKKGLLIVNDLREGINAAHAVLNALYRGDNTQATSAVISSMPEEVRKGVLFIDSLSENITKLQSIITSLSRGDNTQATSAIINAMPEEVRRGLMLINDISENITKLQSIITSLSRGDNTQATSAIINSLPEEIKNRVAHINDLNEVTRVCNSLINTLTGDAAQVALNIGVTLSETAELSKAFSVLTEIKE